MSDSPVALLDAPTETTSARLTNVTRAGSLELLCTVIPVKAAEFIAENTHLLNEE